MATRIKMKTSTPATITPAIVEFNAIQFEKKLTGLKDSQDSINATCHWCLENREHHKKIVITWLNVLKRVKVEQRLTLFYLANDVIQYSKRKNYEFVDSWSTALQKATTMVREEKVKNKIIRIFKIWEQRGIYGEEFITDLCGLISVSPTARKGDEPHEFQSQYLIQKIRNCAKLEVDTDAKLKQYKMHNPKLMENNLCSTLKDRAHKDDVEQELEEYIKHMEAYVEALKIEMKTRNHLITLLLQAESQLEHDKKDVKLVATAYKTFASRVKTMKKRADELKERLPSPVPSPDIDAPSPSPDSDLDFPLDNSYTEKPDIYGSSSFPSAGFYNPVSLTNNSEPLLNASQSFDNNGFASFMGSSINFNIQDMFASSQQQLQSNIDNSSSTTSTTTESYIPPPSRTTNTNPASGIVFSSITIVPPPSQDGNNGGGSQTTPLAPPPMPPFAQSLDGGYGEFNNAGYDQQQQQQQAYADQYGGVNQGGENNQDNSGPIYIEDDMDNRGWMQETPTSPPHFEREAFEDVPEYHDDQNATGELDVDHRVISMTVGVVGDKIMSDLGSHKKTDVDHRNLISLTGGSPRDNSNPDWPKSSNDQDYRLPSSLANLATTSPLKDLSQPVSADQDYRLLPPPPPSSASAALKPNLAPKDTTNTIDMDLSDDDEQLIDEIISGENDNENNPPPPSAPAKPCLLPPPPFPDFGPPDDSDVYNDLPPAREPLLSQASIWQHRHTATLQWNAAAPPPPPPPLPMLPMPTQHPIQQQDGPGFYHHHHQQQMMQQYNDGYEQFDNSYGADDRGGYNNNNNNRGGGGGKQLGGFRQQRDGGGDRYRGGGGGGGERFQGFRPRGRGRGRGVGGGGRGRFHDNY